ncbi:MAG: hypothetical protein SangKO_032890 [Sandaracinaceae bacterium]
MVGAVSDPDEQIEGAPEGASCAEHPERGALVTCPRCGSYCCIACWQPTSQRCHRCLVLDPPGVTPWADRSRGLFARFASTVIDAARPTGSAAGFASGGWRSAISFALLTFVPLALLSGVVPFTHRLMFAPPFRVVPLNDPSATELALDVAGAAGLGLLVNFALLALLALPYVSLSRAYGKPVESEPARQVMLYRAWLVPMSGHVGVLLSALIWAIPIGEDSTLIALAEVVSIVPLLMLLWAMSATARVSGVGPVASMVVVLVAFLLMSVGEPLLGQQLAPLLPDSEATREAFEAGMQ